MAKRSPAKTAAIPWACPEADPPGRVSLPWLAEPAVRLASRFSALCARRGKGGGYRPFGMGHRIGCRCRIGATFARVFATGSLASRRRRCLPHSQPSSHVGEKPPGAAVKGRKIPDRSSRGGVAPKSAGGLGCPWDAGSRHASSVRLLRPTGPRFEAVECFVWLGDAPLVLGTIPAFS